MTCIVWQLFKGPFILIDIIAQTYLRVNIISEQIDVGLTFWTSVERWVLEESLLDGAIVIDMDCVFEHVVHEVGVGLNEVIES